MWVTILMMIPWGALVSALFGYLAKKYGDGFMGWVFALVAENAEGIRFGKMTKAQAEQRNIELIQIATAQSPGISTHDAKFINWVAYSKWLSDNKPAEFQKRVKRFISGAGKLRSYTTTDFMELYISRPDRR